MEDPRMTVTRPTTAKAQRSSAGAFATPAARRRYVIVVVVLLALSVLFAGGLLAWDNPLPFGTPGFWRIAELRLTNVIVMGVVAFCQAMATCLLYTSPSPRDLSTSRMPSSA